MAENASQGTKNHFGFWARAQPPIRPGCHLDTQNTVFLTVWTPKCLGQNLLMMTIPSRQCMYCHSYNTNKAVTGLKKQNLQIYRVHFISSVNFIPHFRNPKVYETSVWTPCFQILAKTMLLGALGDCNFRAALELGNSHYSTFLSARYISYMKYKLRFK